MNFSAPDIQLLKSAFAACSAVGIDTVFINDAQIRGTNQTTNINIISPLKLSLDPKTGLGIGSISALSARLGLFGDEPVISATLKDDVVSLLNIGGGRSKIQFRCTAERLIRYPKANQDVEMVYVRLKKHEIAQLVKAVKALSAETFVLIINAAGAVSLEATSPQNETFSLQIEDPAEFENDACSVVHTYEGSQVTALLSAAVKTADEMVMVVGEYGSLTVQVNGCTMVATPHANHEDYDDE